MKRTNVVAALLLGLSSAVYGLQTAGTLAVDLDVNDLSALNGEKITSWTNDGYLGGVFTNATDGQGAVFTNNLAGAKAVRFDGNVNTIMKSDFGVPVDLTSNKSWSVETWVYNPSPPATVENFLAWTPRGDSDDADLLASYELMELRFCVLGNDNTLEHYAHNVNWGARGRPDDGAWHHLVYTRDMNTNIERIYVDGGLNSQATLPLTNIRTDGMFVLGGTQNGAKTGFEYFYSGYMGKARIHTNTLSAVQVVQNYMEERGEYGVTAEADAIWQGSASTPLNWNDTANWVAGSVPEGGSYVTIDNGGIAVLTNSLSSPLANITSINGGLIISNNAVFALIQDLPIGAGSGSSGTVTVNGAEIEARRIYTADLSATSLIYLNGGVIRNKDSRADFFERLDGAFVQTNGVTFDIISGTTVTASQHLLEDPLSTGGGLTKMGEGTLILSGTNNLTGGITVNAGDIRFDNAAGLDAFSGEITLSNADSDISYNKAGGIPELLALMDTNSVGSITVLANNSADDVDFSDFPGLTLILGAGVVYTGTYTPYGSTYTFYPVGTGHQFTQIVTGTANVEVFGTKDDEITFTGDSSYSGGTLIDGCELIMDHTNALGTGSITLTNSAVLSLNASPLSAAFAQRITAGSKGFIMLTNASAGVDLDLSGLPGIQVGTKLASLTYTGEITPTDGAYRFTGGGQQMRVSGNNGLLLNNLDGTEAVVVENGNEDREFIVNGHTGGITLNNNSYSGGTIITNRGLVRLNNDAFSAVPSTVDPDNIYVDDGCIRFANDITFSETRGLMVGPGGLELHPWGGRTYNINGPLSGTGDIFSTDGGSVYFGGTNNTWSGELLVNGGRTIGVGYGDRFSWNTNVFIVGLGGNFVIRYNGDLTWSSDIGAALGTDGANLLFRKDGSGTLTIDDDPVYTQNTVVEGGTLKAATAAPIPYGGGKGDLSISSGASVDVDDYNISVNGLSGAGSVQSSGSATTFTAGVDNDTTTFSGSIAPGLKLTKVGTGTLTLNGSDIEAASVEAGVLAIVNPLSITGSVDIADNATLRVTGNGASIVGQFCNYSLADQTELNSVAGVEALFAGRTPDLVATIGTDLDFGASAAGFPAPYNAGATENFIAKWEGQFYAETEGEYTFTLLSDDGSSLIIDGVMIVANGALQGYTNSDKSGSVTLSEGYHDFLLAFSEFGGGQGLTAYMTPPGGSQIAIPSSLLSGRGGESEIAGLTMDLGGVIEVETGAALALDIDANTTVDGILNVAEGGVLIKRGASALDLSANGHTVNGDTSVEEGALNIDGIATFGHLDISSGADVSIDLLAGGSARPDLDTLNGLMGYYYDYNSGDASGFETALDSGILSTAMSYLDGQTIDYIENSIVSDDVFYFYSSGDGSTIESVPRSGQFPAGYENTDYFSVIWHGQIVIPTNGTYQFRINSDDSSFVYIDGQMVVNHSGRHDVVRTGAWPEGSIDLTAGAHEIAITFYEAGGGDILVTQILMPGGSWEALPQSMLRPAVMEIGALSGEGDLSLDTVSGGLVITQDVNTVYAGNLSVTNTAVVYKTGASTLTLTGDNSGHEGGWSIMQGILQVGDGATCGVLGGTDVYIAEGAELIFNCPNDMNYAGTITGGGTIRSIGEGVVRMTGDLSGFTGELDLNIPQGTLMILH